MQKMNDANGATIMQNMATVDIVYIGIICTRINSLLRREQPTDDDDRAQLSKAENRRRRNKKKLTENDEIKTVHTNTKLKSIA